MSVLSDDCFLLDAYCINSGLKGVAAYPSLRLWPDSADHSFPDAVEFCRVSGFSDKRQRFLEKVTGGKSVPVSALFILNDPHQTPGPDAIKIAPAGGKEAAIALVSALLLWTQAI